MNFCIGHRSSEQCRWITLSVMLVFVLAGVVLTGRASSAETDECISKPNAPAPQGSHWYYRTDRTSKRQCWYLGEEGAKARASERLAGTPVPTPPPKPVLQPFPKYRDDVALVEPAVSGGAEKSPQVSVASIEWQPLPSSAFSTGDTTLQRNEQSADDLPVKSPTPAPANQPPAGEPVQHAIGLGALFAVLGGALSIAILICRFVRGTASRSKLRESQTTASEPANVAEQAPPKFVPTIIATNAQADQLQNWMTEQGDQNGDIEASVRRLLQELQRRYRELHGRDFKPPSESSAPPSYGR